MVHASMVSLLRDAATTDSNKWLRHERLAIRMDVVEMRHHAAPQLKNVHIGTQTGCTFSAPAPVVEYLAPGPVFHAALALVIGNVTPTPVVTRIEELLEPPVLYFQVQNFEVVKVISQERLSERSIAPVPVVYATPALAVEYVAPALVTEYVTPLRALGFTNVVNPHVSLTAVEASAPHVMETLPSLNVPVPQPMEESVEVTQLVPQEPTLQRTDEQIVDVTANEIVEEILEVLRRETQRS